MGSVLKLQLVCTKLQLIQWLYITFNSYVSKTKSTIKYKLSTKVKYIVNQKHFCLQI